MAVAIILLALFVVQEVPVQGSDAVASDPGAARAQALSPAGLLDADNDTLPDVLENYAVGTNTTEWDTNGDGVPDGWLWRHGFDPLQVNVSQRWAAYPGPSETPSTYGDSGLPARYRLTVAEAYAYERPTNWTERVDGPNPNALDPTQWESPSGLPIPWLVHYGLPLDQAPDVVVNRSDGSAERLTVREAYEHDTDPTQADSDGDGLTDVEELERYQTDPSRFSTSGSGIPDGWLIEHQLDLFNASIAFEDPDNDGLTNREEYLHNEASLGRSQAVTGAGLSPHELSSGGSGLPDGWLVEMGVDPFESDVAERVVSRSDAHDLEPGGEQPPPTLDLPEVNLTVHDAYAYDRPSWWHEPNDGVWWGGLDPAANDTDDDGLPDVVELRGWHVQRSEAGGNESSWTRVDADPRKADSDGDGLLDLEEFEGRLNGTDEVTFPPTDPRKRDSDFDGLDDHTEVTALGSQATGEQGGLDPMDPDSDADGLEDGREWRYWTGRETRYRQDTSYEFNSSAASVEDWVQNLTWVRRGSSNPSGASLARLFAPDGDLDDDGSLNILDDDADDDGLKDGWEVDPALYRESPFASPFPRPETDPGNPDTDGDQLPDEWETRHGVYDPDLGGWNLDPSRWSSLRDGVSDARTDLDDDGITWYTYHSASVGLAREEHTFEGTNVREFRYGTDPNVPDTSGEGLLDGWEIFWGIVYPSKRASEAGEVYPGAPGGLVIPTTRPLPDPTSPTEAVTDEFSYQRLSESPDPIEKWGEDRGSPIRFTNAEGEQVTTYLLRGTIPYGFLDHQEHGTNPYVSDADGDRMPDALELLANVAAPSGEKLDPSRWDANGDPDGDGLTNREEAELGTSPFRADTDFGGVSDRQETQVGGGGLDPLDGADDRSFLNVDEDRDGDNLPDSKELFETETNISRVDTDRDGLVDGPNLFLDPSSAEDQARIEELDHLGIRLVHSDDQVVARGEQDAGTDPLEWDTSGDGVPDGWRDGFPSEPAEFYKHCRPDDWDEATMGPWWWGLDPSDPAHDPADPPSDLDRDGLNDLNGEDPYPCATPEVKPPDGVPWEPGITASTAFERALAYGVAPDERSALADRDAGQSNGVPDVRDRAKTRLIVDSIEGSSPGDGPIEVWKTRPGYVTGRLVVDEEDAQGQPLNPEPTPVPNAAVVVSVLRSDLVAGVGFTDANGRFNVSFQLTGEHTIEIPEPGMVAMGEDEGTVRWDIDPSAISSGRSTQGQENTLKVWTYNTSASVEPGHPTFHRFDALLEDAEGNERVVETHAVARSSSPAYPIDVISGATVSLEAASETRTGGTIRVTVHLSDGTGTPLGNQPVHLGWDGNRTHEVHTAPNGTVTTHVPVSVSTLGSHELTAFFPGDPEAQVRKGFGSTNVLVKSIPELDVEVDPEQPTAGDRITVRGLLADGRRSVSNATLRISGFTQATVRTGEDGRFSAPLEVPPGAEPGPASLQVDFAGTDTFLPTQDTVNVTLVGKATIEGLNAGTIDRGTRVPLQGNLLDGDGSPLPGREVELSWDDAPIANTTTGPEGRFLHRFEVPARATPGPRTIEASFEGDGAYLPATSTSYLVVATNTTIRSQGSPTPIRGEELVLRGQLLDDANEPVPNKPVTLQTPLANETSDVTDASGTFALRIQVPADAPLGPTSARITFDGSSDGSYRPSALSLELRVREATILDLQDQTLSRGSNTWTGILQDRLADPVSNGTVNLLLDGELRAITQTTDEGRFTLRFTLPEDAGLTDHDVQVRYPGSPTLAPSSENRTVAVVTEALLNADAPQTVLVGDTASITGEVTDPIGNPLDQGSVQVEIPGIGQGVGQVSAGSFEMTVSIPSDAPLGPRNLLVAYEGTRHVSPTATTLRTKIVEPADLDIDVPSDTEAGTLYQATIQLRRSDGEPIADAPLIVRSSEGSTPHLVLTDDGGQASVPIRTDHAGSFTFEIAYPGTETIAPAQVDAATIASFQHEDRSWGLLATGIALLGLSALGYVAVRWWRGSVRQAARILDHALEAVSNEPDARKAVLLAYNRFEEVIQLGGVQEAPERTPRETVKAVQSSLPIATAPAQDLAQIFERTLYGSTAPTEADRQRVIEDLRRVRDDLRALLSEDTATPDAGAREVSG